MLELMIALADNGPWKKGDVILAKPQGQPWGRRELRPAAGKSRVVAIVQFTDATLEARLGGRQKAAPYSNETVGSTKTVDVNSLSTVLKNRLADRTQAGRLGTVTVRNKTPGELLDSPIFTDPAPGGRQ